jgi:hypothetical protein
MSILAAIRREEKKVKKQLAKLQSDLDGLQSAARDLGKSVNRELTSATNRVISAAAKAKMHSWRRFYPLAHIRKTLPSNSDCASMKQAKEFASPHFCGGQSAVLRYG